jgi:hypothetical protein
MKREEEEKEYTFVFSGVMKRKEDKAEACESNHLWGKMETDDLCAVKIHHRPHLLKIVGDQA